MTITKKTKKIYEIVDATDKKISDLENFVETNKNYKTEFLKGKLSGLYTALGIATRIKKTKRTYEFVDATDKKISDLENFVENKTSKYADSEFLKGTLSGYYTVLDILRA